ncbi:MAG: hypothetical protein IJ131_10985 [Eggerthellaceae bacterium]|nr:hypothetical protein [Eggerthellaceae bacterium]MBQ9069556.1 hypothetical protein [Eggerthellaceae bacterium]
MGNRAVITTPEKRIGMYLHWNGGRDTIEPLLAYCEMQGYRPPSTDCYGWARMAQVIGNFFGGSLSVGIDDYERIKGAGDDSGVYVIDGWKIVGRELPYEGFHEQDEYDFAEMLRAFDKRMPEEERLGEYLDAIEVPTSELQLGEQVWTRDFEGLQSFPVVGFGGEDAGFGKAGKPYVANYDHDGDYSWNPNNYVDGDTCRIRPRK